MRYFFHVRGVTISDPDLTGKIFSTQDGAKAFAMHMANELAKEGGFTGAWVLVTDEVGAEIIRVSIE